MKKIFLAMAALFLTLAVSAQQKDPAKWAQTRVNNENGRVGNTLSEEQKKKMYDAFFEFASKGYDTPEAKKAANKKMTKDGYTDVLTPEQVQARKDYIAKLNAERAAKKAAE